MQAELEQRIALLREWLEDRALPLWWNAGAAKPAAGFHERLQQDGKPMHLDNRRARVQPRQVYCYATAGLNGWNGPWREAIDHGRSWFEHTYRLENELYGNLADARGNLIDPVFDLYNQAFALFSAAAIATAIPERAASEHQNAITMLNRLKTDYAHPLGGFEEGMPVREPLCSNPHMHLFEAALAWESLPGSDLRWTSLADEIATLATTRFIDADTGALREFFDRNWNPMPGEQGRIVEPGHQFEWAWLLARWAECRNNPFALAKAKRLFEIGETYGICRERGVAVMSLDDDFTVRDGMARLWPQSEWLKASLRLALNAEGEERGRYLQSALRAHDALSLFLTSPTQGLWYDKWPPKNDMIDEPAPASTFYHIVCSIYEAGEVLRQMRCD